MKKAFTLIEVNLAIMVMAVGILGIISLYAFGFREERQSREDVASAAYADAVMGPLVTALTATNVTWNNFKELGNLPGDDGWGSYFANKTTGKVLSGDELKRTTDDVYSGTIKDLKLGGFPTGIQVPPDKAGRLLPALVVMHDRGSAVVRISFRATEKANLLFAAPLYYTEARFQGIVDEREGDNK